MGKGKITQGVIFPKLTNKPIHCRSDEPHSSADDGLLLKKAAEERSGMIAELAGCLTDRRQPGKVKHPIEALVVLWAYGICAGCADNNNAARLAHDLIFKRLTTLFSNRLKLVCDGNARPCTGDWSNSRLHSRSCDIRTRAKPRLSVGHYAVERIWPRMDGAVGVNMESNISLEDMSTADKLDLMERLWTDLTKSQNDVPAPEWQGRELRRREEASRNGEEELLDWDVEKDKILDSFS